MGTLDRYGEPLPLEDDTPLPGRDLPPKSRCTDAEILSHCAELRAVLAAVRELREAQP